MNPDAIAFEPIVIYPRKVFNLDEPMLRWHNGHYALFHPGADGKLHKDSAEGLTLPPISCDGLNPFLVAFSCHNKLKHYFEHRRRQNLPDRDSPHFGLFQTLGQLVREVYKPFDSRFDEPNGLGAMMPRISNNAAVAPAPQRSPGISTSIPPSVLQDDTIDMPAPHAAHSMYES